MSGLKCQHCGHQWSYRGKNKFYATCPGCQYKVKIPHPIPKKKTEGAGRRELGGSPVKLLGIAGMVDKVIEGHQHDEDMLIQILLRLQKNFGWLSKEMLSEVSIQLGVPLSQVYQIATFYKAFSLAPRGKNLIRVCMGTSCKVRGSSMVLERIQNLVGTKPGDTTPDLKFSLETVNCLGCCAMGPVMVVGDRYFGHLKVSDAEKALKLYG